MSLLGSTQPRTRSEDSAPPVLRPPTGGRDRRVMMAIASLVVICASVAAFASLYSSAGHKISVVVVDQALVQGQPVTAAQLGRADVSVSSGVDYIPVAQASIILGKRASIAVPAGSLLTPGDLTAAPSVAAGNAVVGLALKAGQFPAAGLVPGQQVMIVQTATPGSPLSAPVSGAPTATTTTATTATTATGSGSTVFSGSGTGVLVAQSTVFSVSAPSASAGGAFALLVSVEVSSAIAPAVATASSAGQVSLVLLPQATGAAPAGSSGSPSTSTGAHG